jgi:CHAD domain-containing protein
MGHDQQEEIERKYAVDEFAVLPLAPDDGGLRVERGADVQLDAVYFDTPGLDLFARGITLRRRTGGDDAGWHLKVPRGSDWRTETHHPLGHAATPVPHELVGPVRAIVRDRELCQVAVISTHRQEHLLLDDDDHTVAAICDDHVRARLLPEGQEQSWREWEVELADGQPSSQLADIEERLLAAGASPADDASKLARVLSSHPRGDQSRPPQAQPEAGTAGAVLLDRLAEQVGTLHEQDAAVRARAPEGVHRMRIAARRLRSALASAKRLLAPGSADEIREELRWLGQELSRARDAQVIGERLAAVLEAQPSELVMGPVRARLDTELHRDQAQGLARALEALDSTRYFRLLDALDALVANPPFVGQADEPARVVVAALVRRDAKRLRRAVRAAEQGEAGSHAAALHEARKKAKRLRYAAELAEPVGGRRAKRLVKRAKAVQQELGEHQDTVVARGRLRELGAQAFLHGENGFTFGLLHALEGSRAAEAEQRFRTAWDRMPGPNAAERWVGG